MCGDLPSVSPRLLRLTLNEVRTCVTNPQHIPHSPPLPFVVYYWLDYLDCE